MDAAALDFLKQLLETPSPSGYEARIQEVVRQYVAPFAQRVTTDLHGNVMAVCNPEAPLRVMLAGNCDQIGLIVQHIDTDGFVYVQPIGGWDPIQLVGQRMTVWSAAGPVPAIISRKPIHLLTEEERKQVPKMKDLWLDIGAKNKEEASGLVRVGDCVTLELGFRELRAGLAYAPAMDDKCGLWVVIEALRRASQRSLACAVYAVSTVQEEVGLRGAKTASFGIDPQVGVAVDVTHATDCPTIDKKQEGEVTLGAGPVIFRGPNMNPRVVEELLAAAGRANISYQLAASCRATGTDANSMQINRAGMAVGLVSIPNRYMHSAVEMISLADIDHAADLLADFVAHLTPDTALTP